MIPALYADQVRVERRSGALLSAKRTGQHVGTVTADLLGTAVPSPQAIADVGCGAGHPTRAVAYRFPSAQFLAIDASAAMLAAARSHLRARLPSSSRRFGYLQADFHQLPVADGTLHGVTSVFCLYHSLRPEVVIGEFARCLRPGGGSVLVTKSADSYRELDQLLADTGLDPGALDRPSLYGTAHGDSLPELAANALKVVRVHRDRHTFLFRSSAHLAEYLVTVPKYQFAEPGCTDPAVLADLLRRRRGDAPYAATSTVVYVVARK